MGGNFDALYAGIMHREDDSPMDFPGSGHMDPEFMSQVSPAEWVE